MGVFIQGQRIGSVVLAGTPKTVFAGDGSDGDLTIPSGTVDVGGVKFYNDVTIALGAVLRIDPTLGALTMLVKGTLTINGTIDGTHGPYKGGSGWKSAGPGNGADGQGSTVWAGAGGGGGWHAGGPTYGGYGGYCIYGRAARGVGNPSSAPGNGTSYTPGGMRAEPTWRQYVPNGIELASGTLLPGSGGGGGASADGAGWPGGDGGDGGGVLYIECANIVIGGSGLINCNGANGTAGAVPSPGGGGGGGSVLIRHSVSATNVVIGTNVTVVGGNVGIALWADGGNGIAWAEKVDTGRWD